MYNTKARTKTRDIKKIMLHPYNTRQSYENLMHKKKRQNSDPLHHGSATGGPRAIVGPPAIIFGRKNIFRFFFNIGQTVAHIGYNVRIENLPTPEECLLYFYLC